MGEDNKLVNDGVTLENLLKKLKDTEGVITVSGEIGSGRDLTVKYLARGIPYKEGEEGGE